MKSIFRIALLGMAAVAVSCSDNGPKWHLNGSIEGLSEDDNIILEANNQGYWYVVDTINAKNGKLDYASDVHGYPDIFRLRVGDSSVYFPVDCIAKGVKAMVADEEIKRQLAGMILADPAGVVSYYIISKTIGDTPLYNPSAPMDNRIIGAVANSFNSQRPDDPRTKYLTSLFLRNRRPSSSAEGSAMQAQLIKAFEIDLYDHTGKRHSLLELTESGRPVILSFTAYSADWSPAFNVELNKVYSKYHPNGLEIYQVSVDEDEYAWKQAAKNLPWITVYNNVADGGKVLRQYNVAQVPTTFVFNREGELVERVLDIADLDSAVAKVM